MSISKMEYHWLVRHLQTRCLMSISKIEYHWLVRHLQTECLMSISKMEYHWLVRHLQTKCLMSINIIVKTKEKACYELHLFFRGGFFDNSLLIF